MENNNNLPLEDEQVEAVSGGLDIEYVANPAAAHAPADICLPLNGVIKPAGIFMTENTELDGNHAKVGILQWFKSLFGNL